MWSSSRHNRLASRPPPRRRGGRQLPGPARTRADDLDADRVRDHDVGARRFAFPRISGGARGARREGRENIDESERQREEADELLDEYRERLKEAREQADDIVARAKQGRRDGRSEATEEGKAKREELVAAARKDIEAETRRSLEQIRKEVADLTVLATEKVARKSLDSDDQKRLVEEALAEVDFSALAGERPAEPRGTRSMEEIAQVYSEALFDVAKENGRARRDPRAARRVRRRDRGGSRPAGLLLQPLLLLDREAGRDREGDHRRRTRSSSTSSSCSPRSTGCRPCSGSASASTSSGTRRTSASR